MSPINKKMLRFLWGIKFQVLAVCLVIGGGVSTLIMSLSTIDTLKATQERYYTEYAFADVFAGLYRAPESLINRLYEIEGVQLINSRVVQGIKINLNNTNSNSVSDLDKPINGLVLSVPDKHERMINGLYIKYGRWVDPSRSNEIILDEAFASVHKLIIGQMFTMTIDGKQQIMKLVGIASSPEYIYQIRPGGFIPDYKHFVVGWMAKGALQSASEMEGAFNYLVFLTDKTVDQKAILEKIDNLLKPYSGFGAIGRADQASHRLLNTELEQLASTAMSLPSIFLLVAAFLLNIIIKRTLAMEREEIGTLKAFGYRTDEIRWHYQLSVLIIATIGLVFGILLGTWMGYQLSKLYMTFYRFPFLEFQLSWIALFITITITYMAAWLGSYFAIRTNTKLSPAEALREEAPSNYHSKLIHRLTNKNIFDQATRITFRYLSRFPIKALLTMTGIAFACAIMMIGEFQKDSMNEIVNLQLRLANRENMQVSFIDPRNESVVYQLKRMQGVNLVEPVRQTTVVYQNGNYEYRTGLRGITNDAELTQLIDKHGKKVTIPKRGILMTKFLADKLHITPGDIVTVKMLNKPDLTHQVTLVGTVEEYIGLSSYSSLEMINRLLQEGPIIDGVKLSIDKKYELILSKLLQDMPFVGSIVQREQEIQNFNDSMSKNLLTFTLINSLLGGVIAFGVVYNNAQISFSERYRELATLKVLGFRFSELAFILLGELALLTLIALPIGYLFGYGMCVYIASSLQSDIYRVPLVLSSYTISISTTVILISTVVSAVLISLKMRKLNLVKILKERS